MTAGGIMLCDDLIFFSRVAGTARAAGLAVRQAKTPAAVLDLARQAPPGGVLLDLHADGLDLPAFLAELRAVCPVTPRTVAFGSHVAADLLKAARQAGCDRVLPRSQFVKELEAELAGWLTPGEREQTPPPGPLPAAGRG
ncbi:MAG: hypothetical protein K2X82_09105 [Gemmataceae bacterium]|nr:hypothetical protein [Gemmataceae bacterium]